MTTFQNQNVTCTNCGTQSVHSVLGSTNQFGSPDLDLRPPQMARSTMNAWLQECPECGLVAPNLQEEAGEGLESIKSPEYLSAQGDHELPALARRFVCRAIIAIARLDPQLAYGQMLRAAWVADDAALSDMARACRLKAVEYLGDQSSLHSNERMQLLDVLRRAGAWEQAEELVGKISNKEQDDNLKEILVFQSTLSTRRDQGCYKVEDAFPKFDQHEVKEQRANDFHISLISRLRRCLGL